MRHVTVTMVMLCAGLAAPGRACAQAPDTAFTYQGQLKENGLPANGRYDVRFTLMGGGGTRLGNVCVFGLEVVQGLFTADIDFGAAVFDGSVRMLRVAVNPHAPGQIQDCTPNTFDPFTTLVPDQPLGPAPQAIHALKAGPGHSLDAPDGSPVGALVVDANGNVGIGTAVPQRRLHVRGGCARWRRGSASGRMTLADSSTRDPTEGPAMTQTVPGAWVTQPDAYRRQMEEKLGGRAPLEVLGKTADALEAIVARHSAATLRTRPFPGKWTQNEIIGHLSDSEWVYGYRLRLILCETEPTILGMDQDLWVSGQRHNEREPKELVTMFRQLRVHNLAIWRQTSEADLKRVGQHNERGAESLGMMLRMLAGHDLHHIDQIERYLAVVQQAG